MRHLAKSIIVCTALLIATNAAAAQQTRSITSDDFASQRPATSKLPKADGLSTKRMPAKAIYKYVRKGKRTTGWVDNRRPAKTQVAAGPAKVSEIGVTIWKLRPSVRADVGTKLPVRVSGALQMWTAERVSTETVFRAGDRIRLAVESPFSGYLYVINSEIGSDGSFGHPFLIFPDPANQDGAIVPGMLVDIPDQREDLPYFVMSPKKENYGGEAIAIVISPVPLRIKVDEKRKIEDVDNLEELISGSDAEIFIRTDRIDKIYTSAESQSACGTKSRQLEREKSTGQPCGTASRQLTREEPLPQTIYRVKTTSGKPAVALIELRTGN